MQIDTNRKCVLVDDIISIIGIFITLMKQGLHLPN